MASNFHVKVIGHAILFNRAIIIYRSSLSEDVPQRLSSRSDTKASKGFFDPWRPYTGTFWKLHFMTLSRVLELIETSDFRSDRAMQTKKKLLPDEWEFK